MVSLSSSVNETTNCHLSDELLRTMIIIITSVSSFHQNERIKIYVFNLKLSHGSVYRISWAIV
ncbi:CLUMA_CG018449, isoform A [Clunio marinus]|uniref:CLUMA_CG018449, isoform A n=1 Tax=Clunio marinus TaxID=568069 RepID=A0A1J1IXH3_9DIPT|nr:CLUMA_CG018449, isoform A [Clunio marinus]